MHNVQQTRFYCLDTWSPPRCTEPWPVKLSIGRYSLVGAVLLGESVGQRDISRVFLFEYLKILPLSVFPSTSCRSSRVSMRVSYLPVHYGRSFFLQTNMHRFIFRTGKNPWMAEGRIYLPPSEVWIGAINIRTYAQSLRCSWYKRIKTGLWSNILMAKVKDK